MNKITLNQGPVLMGQFKVIIVLFGIFFTIIAFSIKPWIGGILAIVVMLIFIVSLGARSLIEIDLSTKTFRDLTDIVFYGWGPKKSIDAPEKIFINKIKMSQRFLRYGTGAPMDIGSFEYKAFLKLGSGEKLFLISRDSPQKLRSELEFLALELKIPLIENFED